MTGFRNVFILWMTWSWFIVSYGLEQEGDGLMEDFIMAWEAAVEEVETFKEMAGTHAKPDPLTEAQKNWGHLKGKVLETTSELSDSDLENLDPLLFGRSRNSGNRQKRTMELSDTKRWHKGLVPYVVTEEVDQKKRNEIQRTLHTYERFSCIRFVPWENNNGTTTNDELQLGHPSYLKFVARSGCWSFIGNLHKKDGQDISCCHGSTCIHEVGHALGFWHEQTNYLDERNWWIRVNDENILKGKESFYTQQSPAFSLGYDISSYMHYTSTMFGNKKGPTFSILFPGIRVRNSYYYMMNEVAVSHECKKLHCKDFALKCVNDGFVTLVDGKCACMCIPGLDPETGCATPYHLEPAGVAFPGGQWAMPMPAAGCPDGNFTMGSLTHFGDENNYLHYDKELHLKGEVMFNISDMHFCVSTAAETQVKWPAGDYCIYRTGRTCPKDFKEGSFQYENAAQEGKAVSNFTGTVPGGVSGENIRLEFCCRNLGFENDEIILPSNKPLVLFAYNNDCQAVRGMHSYRVQFTFQVDHAKIFGNAPIYKHRTSNHNYALDYCFYKPSKTDCGAVINLTPESPTASFSSPSGKELDCTWLIKAPQGDNILLNFPEFSVTGTSPSCKKDKLELRYAKPGQGGIKICGKSRDQSTRSILNYMYLRFNTHGESGSGFSAEVQLIQAVKQCFLSSDRGATYAGTVNYAENFQMCVPWKDVGHCLHSSFNAKDNNTMLISNYCRLPNYKDGIRPWCYTKAEDCTRTYCDPCLLENRYDVATDCEAKSRKGFCKGGHKAFENCAKTCSENFPPPPTPLAAHKVTCPPPGSAVDGDPVGDLSSLYKAGESVVYKCRTESTTKRRYCLTSGEWSVMGYVCDVCSDGWTYNKVGGCYKWYSHGQNFDVAQATCQELGSTLATAKTDAENKFLLEVSHGQKLWLGLSDIAKEGQWKWTDETVLAAHDWNSWAIGEPNNYGNNEDCVGVGSDGKWNDLHCSAYKLAFICVMPLAKKTVCADFWNECSNIFSHHPEAFVSNQDFVELQCAFTGGICEKNTTSSCPVDGGSDHVITSTNNQRVPRGEIVQYSCAQGFVSKSGSQIRGCQASGKLTGKTFTCMKGCPGEWKFLESTDACYQFFARPIKYTDAEALCSTYNATVTTAKDEVENKFVHSLSSATIWLGLTDRETEGTFVWSDGKKLTGWSHWEKDEPNNHNHGSVEDCTIMYNGWKDYSCTHSYPVVCKIPRPDLVSP